MVSFFHQTHVGAAMIHILRQLMGRMSSGTVCEQQRCHCPPILSLVMLHYHRHSGLVYGSPEQAVCFKATWSEHFVAVYNICHLRFRPPTFCGCKSGGHSQDRIDYITQTGYQPQHSLYLTWRGAWYPKGYFRYVIGSEGKRYKNGTKCRLGTNTVKMKLQFHVENQ